MDSLPKIDENLRGRVLQHFGATAQDYVTSTRHASGGGLEQLVELAEPTPDADALDIATGAGHTALALAPHVRSVVATDLTPEMVAVAQSFITEKGAENVSYEIAGAENLPFPDGSFDIVTCRIAPHHFSDVPAFCRETARVLRPGGRFVLIDSVAPENDELDKFINDVERLRDSSHARSFRVSEWIEMIEAVGLSVDHTEPIVRRINFASWSSRTRLSDEQKALLEQRILSASEEVHAAYHVTITDGRVDEFDDNKALIRARKN